MLRVVHALRSYSIKLPCLGRVRNDRHGKSHFVTVHLSLCLLLIHIPTVHSSSQSNLRALRTLAREESERAREARARRRATQAPRSRLYTISLSLSLSLSTVGYDGGGGGGEQPGPAAVQDSSARVVA